MLLDVYKNNDKLKIILDKNNRNQYDIVLMNDNGEIDFSQEIMDNSVEININDLLNKIGDKEGKWTITLFDNKRNTYKKLREDDFGNKCITEIIPVGLNKAALIYLDNFNSIIIEISKDINKLIGIFNSSIYGSIEVSEYSVLNNKLLISCNIESVCKNRKYVVMREDVYTGGSEILKSSIEDNKIAIYDINLIEENKLYYIKIVFISEIIQVCNFILGAVVKENYQDNCISINLVNNSCMAIEKKDNIRCLNKYNIKDKLEISNLVVDEKKLMLNYSNNYIGSLNKEGVIILSDELRRRFSVRCEINKNVIFIPIYEIEEILKEHTYIKITELLIHNGTECIAYIIQDNINIKELDKSINCCKDYISSNSDNYFAELSEFMINDVKVDNEYLGLEANNLLDSNNKYEIVFIDNDFNKSVNINVKINKNTILIPVQSIEEKINVNSELRASVWLKVINNEFISLIKLKKNALRGENKYFNYIENDGYVKSLYCNENNEIKLVNIEEELYINESDLFVQKKCRIMDYFLIKNKLMIQFDMDYTFYDDVLIHITDRKNKKTYIKQVEKIDKDKIYIDCSELIELYSERNARFDILVERRFKGISYIGEAIIYYNKADLSVRYKNGIQTVTKNNLVVVPYIAKSGQLSLMIDRDLKYYNEKYKYATKLKKLSINHGKLSMKIKFSLLEDMEYNIQGISLELRNTTKEFVKYDIPAQVNKNMIIVNRVDISKFEYESFYWDFYIVVKVKLSDENYENIRVRVKSPTWTLKNKLKYRSLKNIINYPNDYILYPYVTGNNCVSLTYRTRNKYEKRKYKIKEFIACYWYKAFKAYYDNKDIYLIYEKFSETAQDNSYYFFQYCRNKYPDKNFYFVIDKESKDYRRVKDDKNVIDFMSVKHLLYICASKLFIASESKGHCYAWRVQRGRIKPYLDKKKFVFLQHGVLALKKIDNAFNKNTAGEAALFIVSSEQEREIVCDYLGYEKHEVAVTGLARWDVIEDKSKSLEEKEIFIMPTWRNWMTEVEEDVFTSSEYYKKYMELLNSEELQKLLEKYNLKVNYFLHPKFKEHLNNFATNNSRINIIEPNTVPINELLMRASLLITDYSSVALEMFYQKKPTIFYQFDIDDYKKYQGSYIDMDTELFGYRSMDIEGLLNNIEDYVKNNFVEKSQFDDLRSQYFKYVDRNNCERIYDVIVDKMNLGVEKKVSTKDIVRKKIKRIMKKIIKKM